MSGSRTKQLRKECARRLGRAPSKADGHVASRTMSVPVKGKDGKTFLQRMIGYLKPKDVVQRDEFRFFKRYRKTHLEEYQQNHALRDALRRRSEAAA